MSQRQSVWVIFSIYCVTADKLDILTNKVFRNYDVFIATGRVKKFGSGNVNQRSADQKIGCRR